MPQNIESFVKTLEAEGVDAGRKAAEKIEADAKAQAEKIIAEGKAKAESIIALANAEAEKIKTRLNSSLELAARDVVFMLREKLSRQITSLLNLNVNKSLGSEETLAGILREVIPAYAKADAKQQVIQLNISNDIKMKLLEGAIGELTDSLKNNNIKIDVRQNLAKAGFEYKINGSTVEVSTESVTELLAELIDPELAKFLEKAADTPDK
jgi:vacuolar-type H+-ATPase subunit E/Vma4